MLDGLTISNGVGWSPDGLTMYLVDSGPRVIHAFAFDVNRGSISAGRILTTVPEDIGAPDGMTVDAAGDLWVAVYGGGRVHRYAPDGSLREVFRVPARRRRAVRSAVRACTACTSRRRRRTGRTSNAEWIQEPVWSTGWRPMPSDDRRLRSPGQGVVVRVHLVKSRNQMQVRQLFISPGHNFVGHHGLPAGGESDRRGRRDRLRRRARHQGGSVLRSSAGLQGPGHLLRDGSDRGSVA